MSGFFKFLRREHVHYYADAHASLRFSSLAYFREYERRTGDDCIGDRTEGINSFVNGIVVTPGDVIREARLRQLGIESKNSHVRIGTVEQRSPHCLVFCFSHGEYEPLRKIMPYDAAVRILDIKALAERVWSGTAEIGGTKSRVDETFVQLTVGPVVYGSKEVPLDGSLTPVRGAFAKALKYGRQSESRIVLVPRNDLPLFDFASVRIPNPGDLFERVAEPALEGDPPPQAPVPFDQDQQSVAGRLDALAQEIDEWLNAHRIEEPHYPLVRDVRDAQSMQVASNLWSSHQDALSAVAALCRETFLARVLNVYWDARVLHPANVLAGEDEWDVRLALRFLESSVSDATPRMLRALATKVRS